MPTAARIKRDAGEQREQHRRESLRGERLVERLLHRADVVDGLVRVERLHLAAHGGGQTQRVGLVRTTRFMRRSEPAARTCREPG